LPWKITLAPLIEATLEQKRDGVPIATIASRFHSTLVQIILNIAKRCRRQFGVDKVVLSGGVFLNRWLP
jgi:hydrogenase maturation protein HypF